MPEMRAKRSKSLRARSLGQKRSEAKAPRARSAARLRSPDSLTAFGWSQLAAFSLPQGFVWPRWTVRVDEDEFIISCDWIELPSKKIIQTAFFHFTRTKKPRLKFVEVARGKKRRLFKLSRDRQGRLIRVEVRDENRKIVAVGVFSYYLDGSVTLTITDYTTSPATVTTTKL